MHCKRLALVLTTVVVLCAAGPSIASGATTLSKLRLGSLGAEDYLYTAGNSVQANGTVDGGSYYRFVVSDPDGTVHGTSACNQANSNGKARWTYVVQPSDPVSTGTAWQFQLQQFGSAGCGGSPTKSDSLYFDVAAATAYADSGLTTPKGFFTVSQTSYVNVLGVGKVKKNANNTVTSDWSITWLLPSSATACANTSGSDRPDSTAGGLFPTGPGPLGIGGYIQFRPNTTATGDAWNRESNYETRPCPAFGGANEGSWRLKLRRDNTHFVTLPVFAVDVTAPHTTITGGPIGATGLTHATFQFGSSESGSTFQCRLDGSAWEGCASPTSYTGLSEGQHTFDVRATDRAGNVEAPPVSRTWTVDTSLPSVTLAAPVGGSWVNDSTPSFSGTAGTRSGDSATVLVNVFSGTDPSGEPLEVLDATRAGDGSWAVDASPALPEGTYTAYAQQADDVGNNGFSEQTTFMIDTQAPRVRLYVPVAGGATNQTVVHFSGAGGTLAGDAAAVSVEIYSGSSVSGTPLETLDATVDGDGNWAATAAPELSDGVYTVRALQLDAAGNTGHSSAHVFTVDTTSPSTWITAGPAGPTASTTATFRFISSEPGSSFQCRLDNSAWGTCTSPKSYYGLGAGAHTFDARAIDAAGNVDPTGATRAWTVVLDLPAIELLTPADGSSMNDTTPTYSGTAGTEAGDSATVTVKIYRLVDGTTELVETRTADRSDNGSWSVDALATLVEGDYVAHAEQGGVAGTGYSAERQFSVDTTPPDTLITFGPWGGTPSDSASFGFDSSENSSTFQCRLDGGPWAACSSPAEYTGLADGSHTFHVRAIDAAGNVDPDPATRTWTIDQSLPAVTIDSPADGSFSNDGALVFSGLAGTADGDADTVAVEVFRTGSDELVETLSAPRAGDGTWSVTASPELDEGTYLVRASQAGALGTGHSAPNTFTVDETPPVTTITAGPTGTTASTDAEFRFISSEAASTFECRLDDGAWATCTSPVEFSNLSADSHAFDVRATDRAGNVDPFGDSRTWVVDPTAPAVRLTSPADGSWTNDTTPTFAGAAGTAHGDSDTITVELYASPSGDLVEELTATQSGGSWSVDASPALPDGTYVAFAQQDDDAGNTGVSASHTFNVDATPSAVTLTAPAADSWTGDATPTLSGAAGTADGDAATVTVKIYAGTDVGGPVVQTLAADVEGGSWSTDASPALDDGTYTARAEQLDLAGNTGYSVAHTFTVDTAPPTVTVTDPGAGSVTNDPTPTFDGDAGTATGDSTNVVVNVYSGTEPNGTLVETLTTDRSGGSWAVDASPALPDGQYTIVAHQSDLAGNDGASAPRTFSVDATAPDTSVTGGPSGTVTETDASFTFTATEAGSTFECRLDGAAWSACSSPAAYSGLALGDHAFDVRASDALGNVDATPASRSWTIVSGGTPPPPPPPQSLSLTLTRVTAKKLLTRGKLVIFATCDQDCTLTVTGKLTARVAHRLRSYWVRKLVVHLAAGVRTKLSLGLTKRRAVVRALRKHRRVTVRLRGVATGANGTSASANLKFSGRR
jgi:hypothetical protein